MARERLSKRMFEGVYDPLDYFSVGIPVSVSCKIQAEADKRGCTVQSLIREAVKNWATELAW